MADSSTVISNATERTRLLDSSDTTAVSYNTQIQREDERSERVVNINLDHEPTVPLEELTGNIQHLLVLQQQSPITPSFSQGITGDQDQNSHDSIVEAPHQKHRKREIITDALRFATDQWRENEGIAKQDIQESTADDSFSSGQLPSHYQKQQHDQQHDQQTLLPLPLAEPQYDSVVSVWDMAKDASVCAVLGLLGERRLQKMSITADTVNDASLQRLALSTLEHGIQQTSAKDMTLQVMLLKPWIGDKSALQWAIDNNCSIFLDNAQVQNVIKKSWLYGDADWRSNRHHPFQVWNPILNIDVTTVNAGEGWKPLTTKESIIDYFSRWASPRYQCLISLFTAFVYLGFHLATLSNTEYMEDHMQDFEYFYYFLVISDLVLELWKLIQYPRMTLRRPSTYLSLSIVVLLFVAFVMRIMAFSTIDLQPKYQELYFSFVLLSIATPLMFFRLFLWMDALWWPVYKVNYIVGQCMVKSLWVFCIALVSLIGFWVGLSALQRDDIGPWLMLRLLVLGALHTPEIDETVYYQPQAASILLVVYLFIMVILIGALLVASFLSTILSLMKPESSFGKLRTQMEVNRCSRPMSFGVFIPNVAVELIIGAVTWSINNIYPGTKLIGLERLRQVVWFVIFSPVILVIGLVDLIVYLFYPSK